MTIFKAENYSRGKIAKLDGKVGKGDTFIGCNFCQVIPYTEILKGIENLTFEGCNMLNCKLPKGAVLKNSRNRQTSKCMNIHPNYTEIGCEEVCEHVTEIEKVTVDGVVIETVYTYEDTRGV